jgi:hypothetical protein
MTRSTIRLLSAVLRVWARLPRKSHQPQFAILACTALTLLLPSLAVAQISVVDPIQTFELPNVAQTSGTAFPVSETYSITSSANVLVVEFDLVSGNSGQTPTITWTPSGGSPQTLTNAINQTETSTGSYVYSDISYLDNPTPGANGTITVSTTGNIGQSWAFSAFGLSGVNTSASVITSGAIGTADSFNDTVTGVTAGSFAAIAASTRLATTGTNTTTITPPPV